MELNDELTQEIKDQIDGMTQEEMARHNRFAPAGDPVFAGRAGQYFQVRFQERGGMTPAISKKIGWDR